jgi:DNA-binding LytR/AlgR family response regulator
MNSNHHRSNHIVSDIFNQEKRIPRSVAESSEEASIRSDLIRFEENKQFFWANPEEIIFVKSADHYVKSLIKCGNKKIWMIRHCTLKELLAQLPASQFIRLNKFYLLNRLHFLHIDQKEKILFVSDNFPVPVPHRISRYVLDVL